MTEKRNKESDAEFFIESVGFAMLMLIVAIASITALYMVMMVLAWLISLLTGVPLPAGGW